MKQLDREIKQKKLVFLIMNSCQFALIK